MQEEFPGAKTGELMRLWPRAIKRSRQRGSWSERPLAAEVEAAPVPSGERGKPVDVATASPAPEQPGLSVSPSYDKTKSKILEKVDVPEAERAELARRMNEWENTHTDRRAVTFDDIREEARSLDPILLLHLKRTKPGETLNPALRYAAREMLNSVNEKVFERRKQLAAKQETADPTWILDEEHRIGELERQAHSLLDVLIPTRSQDGRNLAYHRMMAEKSFDAEYWIARAKRAAGGALHESTANSIRETLAEGRQAEEAATQRIRQRQARALAVHEAEGAAPSAPRVAGRNRSRVTIPTTEQKVERAVDRRVKGLEAKIAGEVTEAGPWALTPEERKLVDQDPRVLEARRKLARTMMRVEKTGVLDTITALRRAGLLTGIKTHLRNITGNAAFQVLEETSRIPSAVLDAGMSVFTERRTVEGANPVAFAKSAYEAATRGMREAKQIVRKGATEDELAHMDAFKEMNSGSKVVDAYVNTVFRTMSAEDRVFRVYAFERSLQEQMALSKATAPTEAMRAQAIADAEFATFNNRNVASEAWSRARSAARSSGTAGKALAFGMDLVVPFARTPANILARVIDYTPVGASARIGYHTWRSVAARSFSPEQQRAISTAFGRGLTGSALLYMGWKLGEAGLLTGTAPNDPGQRNTEEVAGRLPGAIRVGDSWQQVGAFSPVGNLMVIGATLQRESTKPLKDEAKRPAAVLKTATATVMEQPMLTGTKDAIEAMAEPGKRLERAAGQMTGSFVPTLVSDVASVGDTARRDTEGEGTLDSIANSIAVRLPGLRNRLPERRDALGREEPQNKLAAVNPGIGSKARELTDPVSRELIRQKVGITRASAKPGETITELQMRREITGKLIESTLRQVVDSNEYQSLPDVSSGDEARRLVLETAINHARATINKLVNHPEYKAMQPAARAAFLKELLRRE